MTLHCIAIDDEPLALNLIQKFVSRIPYLKLQGLFEGAYEALNLLKQEQIDLIFLDVNMPDINGVQFLRNLNHPPMVIFTTAYDKYALDGYELNALDYLLKPFSFDRFLKAVDKAYSFKALKEANKPVLPTTAEAPKSDNSEYIFVKSEHNLVKIRLSEILYIESLKDYVKIFLEGKRHPLLTLHNLKSIFQLLDPNQFIRVHRSFIVSIDKIDAVRKKRILICEREIPLGELYLEDFQKRVIDGKI
ncbi:MAG: LytTR family DNA-binding domain-containing protein [Microscillaceae bacterium]|nr:LytTR family DNA-binding domain-containing protein [Microscillaceae bacterium]